MGIACISPLGGKQSKFQWHEKEQDDSAMGGNDSLMSRDIHDSRGHVRAQARGKVVEPRHGERGLAMAVFNKRVVPWRLRLRRHLTLGAVAVKRVFLRKLPAHRDDAWSHWLVARWCWDAGMLGFMAVRSGVDRPPPPSLPATLDEGRGDSKGWWVTRMCVTRGGQLRIVLGTVCIIFACGLNFIHGRG